MASKKYLLFLVVILLATVKSFSQVDTSVVNCRIGIWNGWDKSWTKPGAIFTTQSNYPAKPRNMWEVGAKVGLFQVSGDFPAKFFSPGFGIHVRKSFGYVFSMRLEYMDAVGKGQQFKPAENFGKNPAWGANIVAPAQRYSAPRAVAAGPGGSLILVSSKTGLQSTPRELIFYNYKTHVRDLSLQGMITLNNIRFFRSQTRFIAYGFAGIGGSTYNTKVNSLNSSGNKYDFTSIANSVNASVYKNRKDVYDALKALEDDSYETPAENHGVQRPKLFGDTFKPSGTVGMGFAYRISRRINLALEDRWTFIKDDLLDGQRWQEHAYGDAVLTRDFDSYNFLSLGLNVNIGAKAVEPLWWLNAMDWLYTAAGRACVKVNWECKPDEDQDGVPDFCDHCPGSKPGSKVDVKGCCPDSDGDGIDDCNDCEPFTPPSWFPVNDCGKGTPPCPTCDSCPKLCEKTPEMDCNDKLGQLPPVRFKSVNFSLSPERLQKECSDLDDNAKAVLAIVGEKMRNNPDCRVSVVGYCCSAGGYGNEPCKKPQQQCSFDHVNAVINWLVDHESINESRFNFIFAEHGGDCNTVDLRAARPGEVIMKGDPGAQRPPVIKENQ